MKKPLFPKARSKKHRRRQISNEERRTARIMGGRKTPNSGAGDEKGDGRAMGRWRSENKETEKLSISIKADVWEKLHAAAVTDGERPVLFLKLMNRSGRPIRLAVIAEDDYAAFVAEENE